MITSNIVLPEPETRQEAWPRIVAAEVMNDGKAIGVLLREFDGTISAIRIPVEQMAD